MGGCALASLQLAMWFYYQIFYHFKLVSQDIYCLVKAILLSANLPYLDGRYRCMYFVVKNGSWSGGDQS